MVDSASERRTTGILERSFIPPREVRWFIYLSQRVSPWVYRLALDTHIELDPASHSRLRALRGQPGMVLFNHPTVYDPVFAFGLSLYAGERWSYLCALEIFRALHPLAARALTWLNTYSVRRGVLDRPSIDMTRRLLVENRKVVIFPEGATYGLNDALLPFQEGAVQMGFWALQDRAKLGLTGPLWVVPVALKYRFLGQAEAEIERRLRGLELRLGLHPGRGDPLLRVVHAGEAVLQRLEREHGVRPAPGTDLNERIRRLRSLMLAHAAEALGVRFREEWTLQDKIRALYNAIQEKQHGPGTALSDDDSPKPTEWEQALEFFHRQVARLQAFQAVQGGYVPSYPTPERFLDLICRLEWEIAGGLPRFHPTALVCRVAEPLDLSAFQAAYRSDKRATVACLTLEARERLRRELLAMISAACPLPGLDIAAVDYEIDWEAYLAPTETRQGELER